LNTVIMYNELLSFTHKITLDTNRYEHSGPKHTAENTAHKESE